MTDKEKKEQPKRQELTPDLAKACMEFLARVELKGVEAQTFVMVQQVINGYIND